jgi:ABC-2 type transport system permease protein
VNLTAFWLIDIRGVMTVAAAAWTLLSGFTMPIAFFPDALRNLLHLLPFVAMLELPMNIFLERAQGADVLILLMTQAVWVVLLLGCGRLVLSSATRKLVVQGG